MRFFDVTIRKRHTYRELMYTVESDSVPNAKAEAKRMFLGQYGFSPRDSEIVSVLEVDRGKLIWVAQASKRGKQLIKKHGDIWRIEKGPVPMQCFDNADGYRVRSVDGCGYFRNIRRHGDPVFRTWEFIPINTKF